jgi:pimeloyl-ACP methyl ester carboxylesterase
MNANALSADVISDDTKVVLYRHNLLDLYDTDVEGVISQLHEKARKDTRRDIRFALAELSFLRGERLRNSTSFGNPGAASNYFLMSALYAYDYLLGKVGEDLYGPYDSRFRTASDFYNRALALSLSMGVDDYLEFEEGVRSLPVGEINLTFDKDSLGIPMDDFQFFLSADDYEVRGLSVRNRTPGLGSSLIAVQKKSEVYPRGLAIPVTAFLKVEGDVNSLSNNSARASLKLYSGYNEAEITVDDRKIPLETDTTTPIAYQLNDAPGWSLGLESFINPGERASTLVRLQPYKKGRIPVIFVHGTASSPVWWAEMWNTLSADPVIRKNFQFAFFFYNSSLPIVKSASDLRRILSEAVAFLDPQGKDPELHRMVIIGHSQGGLLTKLTAVDPGDALWNSVSDKNIDELDTPPEMKALLRSWFLFEPLPFVKRAVYIATPFRGSFLAENWVRTIIKGIVSLPVAVLSLPSDVISGSPALFSNLLDQSKLPLDVHDKMPTSVDGMSAANPILKVLAEMPVAPGVKTHTIIAIDGNEEPPNGNDGVVEYKSAHQESVASEYVVRSPHSCQGNPLTVEEVRRILLEHLVSQ